MKIFTKETLLQAARIAEERDYNRQLDIVWIERELSETNLYPVTFAMVHKHRAGERVAPHIRVMIGTDAEGGKAMLDVDFDLYESLPATRRGSCLA